MKENRSNYVYITILIYEIGYLWQMFKISTGLLAIAERVRNLEIIFKTMLEKSEKHHEGGLG